MSLLARYSSRVRVASATETTGAQGGVTRGFAEARELSGTVMPLESGLSPSAQGLVSREAVSCVFPGTSVQIVPGDGVWLSEDAGAEPVWECVSVKRFTRHTLCRLEKR